MRKRLMYIAIFAYCMAMTGISLANAGTGNLLDRGAKLEAELSNY